MLLLKVHFVMVLQCQPSNSLVYFFTISAPVQWRCDMHKWYNPPDAGPLVAKGLAMHKLACMHHVIPEASFTCCLQMLRQQSYMHPAHLQDLTTTPYCTLRDLQQNFVYCSMCCSIFYRVCCNIAHGSSADSHSFAAVQSYCH